MRKTILALMSVLLVAGNTYGKIPVGTYLLDNITCSNGKKLKMFSKDGSHGMKYTVTLEVQNAGRMKMTAVAKSFSFAGFKLNCTQVNLGKFSYINNSSYQGYLSLDSVKCNVPGFTNRLRRKGFGVEEQSSFKYQVKGNKLRIENPNTITKYSCKKTNSYPIYNYTRN